jgi:hypothetical protein
VDPRVGLDVVANPWREWSPHCQVSLEATELIIIIIIIIIIGFGKQA